MIIKEFRVILPMTLEEYRIAQRYSITDASKLETGGGEGIEVRENRPYADTPIFKGKFDVGQYTHKVYHLASKVPSFVRYLAPKGSLEIHENAWNAFPYCKTLVTNPDYMSDKFHISIETMHLEDRGETENVHELTAEELDRRKVITIDIANDPVTVADYKDTEDPSKFTSEKTGRGPLSADWIKSADPIMCCYKLVRAEFAWFGFQKRVEKLVMSQERRLFLNFHRKVFCWMDRWYGLTISDITVIEERTRQELAEGLKKGSVKGMSAA